MKKKIEDGPIIIFAEQISVAAVTGAASDTYYSGSVAAPAL